MLGEGSQDAHHAVAIHKTPSHEHLCQNEGASLVSLFLAVLALVCTCISARFVEGGTPPLVPLNPGVNSLPSGAS